MCKPALALFDVDETLIHLKSMFSLLNRVLKSQGWHEDDRSFAISRFHRLAERGVTRELVNAAYYRGFAGLSRTWMIQQGQEWFVEQFATGDFFHAPVLDELRELQEGGVAIALVSGSFEACLTPIAEFVGADYVLASEPTTDGDVYTGELSVPMIGEAKGDAVRRLIRDLHLQTQRVRAYGDHISDVPLLRAAEEGVVVGSNPELRLLAASEGWRHLPLEQK